MRAVRILLFMTVCGVAGGAFAQGSVVVEKPTSSAADKPTTAITVRVPDATTTQTLTTTTLPLNPSRPVPAVDRVMSRAVITDPNVYIAEFTAPLSIQDAQNRMKACIFLLDEANREFVRLDRQKIDWLLRMVMNYIDIIDKRYTTLRHYEWIQIGDQEVWPHGTDNDLYELEQTLNNVSAIGLKVTGSDILVEKIEVRDVQPNANVPVEYNKLIPHDQPGLWNQPDEVLFLYSRPINLVAVETTSKVVEEGEEARLRLFAGITSEPEYAKYAYTELDLARQLIEEEKDREAIQALRHAWHHLIQFQSHRNVRR